MSGRLARPAILLGALAAALGTIPLAAAPRLALLAGVGGLLLAGGEMTARYDERRRFPPAEEGKARGRLHTAGDLGLGLGLGVGGGAASFGLVHLGAASSGSGAAYLALGLLGILLAFGALAYLGRPEAVSSRAPRAPWRRGRRP